jgi:hypothetical protein
MRRLMLVCAAWLVACSAGPTPTPTWPPPDATSRAAVAAITTNTAKTLESLSGPTPTPCR